MNHVKTQCLRDISLFTIFHARYIIYLSFINLSSKNSSIEIEFLNQHFFSKKKVSKDYQKSNAYVRNLKKIREKKIEKLQKSFFTYKTKGIDE